MNFCLINSSILPHKPCPDQLEPSDNQDRSSAYSSLTNQHQDSAQRWLIKVMKPTECSDLGMKKDQRPVLRLQSILTSLKPHEYVITSGRNGEGE
jgi:hypothetical protein